MPKSAYLDDILFRKMATRNRKQGRQFSLRYKDTLSGLDFYIPSLSKKQNLDKMEKKNVQQKTYKKEGEAQGEATAWKRGLNAQPR